MGVTKFHHLAASKGFWSQMLGVGDFYYELAIQVIEICIATSHRNGGINWAYPVTCQRGDVF